MAVSAYVVKDCLLIHALKVRFHNSQERRTRGFSFVAEFSGLGNIMDNKRTCSLILFCEAKMYNDDLQKFRIPKPKVLIIFADLLEAMKNCLQIIKVFPFLLEVVFDIKEWLTPFSEELHSHTQPKCFKFLRNEQGKCVMFYRNYSHVQWEGPQQLLEV